jgi:hypothetical protein
MPFEQPDGTYVSVQTATLEGLKKAKLLHTKVVDSSPATSSCHIPVGAAGVKVLMSGNSEAGAMEQRPRQGSGGPAEGATKLDAAAERETGAETHGSVFTRHTIRTRLSQWNPSSHG